MTNKTTNRMNMQSVMVVLVAVVII